VRAGALPFQPSLLAAGPADGGVDWRTAERIELGRGAWVEHAPGWLAGADDLFVHLVEEVDWSQRRVAMYGRMLDEPRLTAWWADDEDPGGPETLPAAPEVLRRLLATVGDRYGRPFDSIGLNLYRDGADSVAWHGDRTERHRAVTDVAVLSLGSPRRFLLRPVGGGTSRRFDLRSGDLLVMGGTCQQTFEHCIPKVARAGPRISATFRRRLPRYSP